MGKVEEALRSLIHYHAKRAAVLAFGKTPRRLRALSREVRLIRRQLRELARKLDELAKSGVTSTAIPAMGEPEKERARYSYRSVKCIRRQFDLTQHELARLLRVSPATVVSWESGKARPRRAKLAQLLALKDMKQEDVDKALGRPPALRSVSPAGIRRLRARLNVTQRELARLLGVSVGAVGLWESGRVSPSRDVRHRMAELQHLPRGELEQRLGRTVSAGKKAKPAGGISPREIETIRRKAGLTQKELAARLGVNPNTVSNWETGATAPRARAVEKLRDLEATV